ncbi:monoacylglycerol lipase ABHD12-like [Limulus polyphemus]|uniref:Monoacylglycerol lipase ABHD12-like n=1 Tax=Limulus polyphemus TaxID=6850 RepID=A0ABM1SFV6_LIMPO|nr:monoacylglycerol lipase ABHD12-like [Limulus polyphemus]XP_022242511.1 monoacylglycerol lipase ABHD12-like [Limulus polyphemus]XP_022242512.1 monoacylglycerol lipase ABHD12-like [Limulus polyphemus]XP_022242513.1 monoacylglycerol lipase ABHD12-like [Limulus polyphemus]
MEQSMIRHRGDKNHNFKGVTYIERNYKHITSDDIKKLRTWQQILAILRGFMITFFILFVFIPTWWATCPWLRRFCVIMPGVELFSLSKNLSAPHEFGLNCTRHFFIELGNSRLGIWHIFPSSRANDCQEGHFVTSEDFKDGRPVFLYFHGAGGTRGSKHRVGLYKTLTSSSIDAHVITFDYRGFGDSSGHTTGPGMVEDAEAVYSWLRPLVNSSQLFIWGHSMGTAVAINMVSKLELVQNPVALFLDSPFANVIDLTRLHPLASIHRYMPFFYYFFTAPCQQDLDFDVEERIKDVQVPVLIFHAEDDHLVPFQLGYDLYQRSLRDRPHKVTEFIALNANLKIGHQDLFKYPPLPEIVNSFMKSASRIS